jgi:hypothetical protein
MRGTLTFLIMACTLYVIHWVIPQPNGAGDLAAVFSGVALLWFLATADIERRK